VTTITWSQIETEFEAETGDYRSRVIAIFRKYEGQDTDEKDGQGRTVKVTVTSFERHMGLGEETLRGWIKKQDRGGPVPARDRTREHINRMAPEEKVKLAAELLDGLPEDERTEVVADAMDGMGMSFTDAVDGQTWARIEDQIASDPAATARVNQRAAEHRPAPVRPAPERSSMSAAASAAALEAAAAQLRRATDEVVADVMDGHLAPELLAEPLTSIETDAKRLRIACDNPTDIDRALADLLEGEGQ
jgi:hypothetical protein